ncbi:MAG: hypothetical protein HeimC2_05120 [Candidatus Heimdallarchaeota archaeon LC_2]|nr:MAG: hypothetical protein HeimC2_05120 [Candidatus Heimdallarchaeota archaeon LC_2]
MTKSIFYGMNRKFVRRLITIGLISMIFLQLNSQLGIQVIAQNENIEHVVTIDANQFDDDEFDSVHKFNETVVMSLDRTDQQVNFYDFNDPDNPSKISNVTVNGLTIINKM